MSFFVNCNTTQSNLSNMETIHLIISESVSGGFWNYVGIYAMTGLIFCGPILMLKGVIKRAIKKGPAK